MSTLSWDFPDSHALYRQAQELMPGGSTRGSIFYQPYPLYGRRGDGCTVEFADGHQARDFLNNFTSLVLGHGHPAVVEAIQTQSQEAVVLGAPTATEVELARLLCDRMPVLDKVVFATTGSESVMLGLRLARAFTGRRLIAKFEGGYHGGYDPVKVSAMVGPSKWRGPEISPRPVADTGGIPEAVVSDVRVATYNSIESVRTLFERYGEDLSVLIMEPVLGVGGLITPEPGFLEEVRSLTRRYGVILFFDEVLTQRLSVGGAHKVYGIDPDLVAVSKVLGGGIPISALGGRSEVMELLNPTGEDGPVVYHSGTYNANPLCAAAAIATTRAITPEVTEHINALGDQARSQLREVISTQSVPASVTGVASLFNIHFMKDQPTTYRQAKSSDQHLLAAFHREMLREGFFLATRGLGCISAPMSTTDIDDLTESASTVLKRLFA